MGARRGEGRGGVGPDVELTQLSVRQFRNIAALDLELPPQGVVVLGDNGQGKTNLLEAIYYLVLFRSLRGARDRELVRFGQPGFFVRGTTEQQVAAGYESKGPRKRITVDGVDVERVSEAVGRVIAVAFAPSDREIVSGPPSARRRYLDVLLALAVPGYLHRLGVMRAALKQRNAALRRARPAEARAFDEALIGAAARVIRERRAWIKRWAGRFVELVRAMGESSEPAAWYRSQVHGDAVELELRAQLEQAAERDARSATTTVGPHRDDLELTMDGQSVRIYGSAGQQRTVAIALRLLESETLAGARDTVPIALYDDVFAELDEDRQARLLGLIQDSLRGQAIIAAPREAEVPRALLERPRWRMRGGVLAG